MKKIICYNLKTFKEKYDETLHNYLEEWEDNSPLSFLLQYEEFYKKCIDNVTLNEPILTGEGNSRRIITPKAFSIKEIHDNIEYGTNKNFEYHHENNNIQSEEYIIRNERINIYQNYRNSFEKILNFINDKKDSTENNNLNKDTFEPLEWRHSKLMLTELVKALILNNCFDKNISDKEVFRKFKTFFGVDEYDHDDKIRDIRKRKNDVTKFISQLETSLMTWYNKED